MGDLLACRIASTPRRTSSSGSNSWCRATRRTTAPSPAEVNSRAAVEATEEVGRIGGVPTVGWTATAPRTVVVIGVTTADPLPTALSAVATPASSTVSRRGAPNHLLNPQQLKTPPRLITDQLARHHHLAVPHLRVVLSQVQVHRLHKTLTGQATTGKATSSESHPHHPRRDPTR